ncbi:FAD-binding protein [Methylomonas rapida]|uniref:FAD-binding protein n=1 Tax=Methylomonas rapida TaxID=2963939 RepID=A0ABY7GRF3_9GAMM|nr:FAD-binding protein [Methylomonas rapida]
MGGNVAENAGGVHCLKYGLTVHNVWQIKLVTMDGELLILILDSGGLDAPGYDLLALAIGSEGLLGLVKDLAEILQAEDVSGLRIKPRRIAFHVPCTLQHGLRLSGIVEMLLTRLGFTLATGGRCAFYVAVPSAAIRCCSRDWRAVCAMTN